MAVCMMANDLGFAKPPRLLLPPLAPLQQLQEDVVSLASSPQLGICHCIMESGAQPLQPINLLRRLCSALAAAGMN
jgi:hypothetical protein